jgi:hypothetical protein
VLKGILMKWEERRITFWKVIENYREALRSDIYASYQKGLAGRIISALSRSYLEKLHEPLMVGIVEDVVNSVKNFKMTDRKIPLELSTKSVFIHGNKSQVQFKYYGKQTRPIELGDLIFISSIVFNGRKYFEKMTINQFKKDISKRQHISWSISNKKQLYLLSRFPTFRGVKGIIPKKNYDLPNYSGCLGSYGLLYKPGDFAFVSATRLDPFMSFKSALKITELDILANYRTQQALYWLPELYPFFGNCHFCLNVFNFMHEYLRMNIGEPIFMETGENNYQAREFLSEIMSLIEIEAKKTNSQELLSFISSFRQFPYADKRKPNRFDEASDFDSEGGRIGIIYTTINVSE